jgi:DNA-binding transcriptional MerR regulator
MESKGFRTGLASRIVGLSFKQIDHYDRCGLVQPELRRAAGRGSRRLFSRRNLIELAVVKKLLDQGITLQKVRRSIEEARRRHPGMDHPLHDLHFRTDGLSVYLNDPGSEAAVDLLHPDQPVLRIALEHIARDIEHAVKEFENHRIEQLRIKGKTYLIEIVNDTESRAIIARCPDLMGISTKGSGLEEALGKMRAQIEQVANRLGTGSKQEPQK